MKEGLQSEWPMPQQISERERQQRSRRRKKVVVDRCRPLGRCAVIFIVTHSSLWSILIVSRLLLFLTPSRSLSRSHTSTLDIRAIRGWHTLGLSREHQRIINITIIEQQQTPQPPPPQYVSVDHQLRVWSPWCWFSSPWCGYRRAPRSESWLDARCLMSRNNHPTRTFGIYQSLYQPHILV